MSFAQFLAYAMDQTGLSKYMLAKRLGMSQTTIANWLAGTTVPSKKKVAMVLNIFGVTENDLHSDCPKISYKQEKSPTPEGAELDPETIELREIWSSADQEEREALLAMAKMLKARRNK